MQAIIKDMIINLEGMKNKFLLVVSKKKRKKEHIIIYNIFEFSLF